MATRTVINTAPITWPSFVEATDRLREATAALAQLNDASESADRLRLIRLFGITEQTAMRYITAAHLERTDKLPR
ncbi:hypothetical protein ACWC4A_38050 [Streptomyces mirabilis]